MTSAADKAIDRGYNALQNIDNDDIVEAARQRNLARQARRDAVAAARRATES